MNEQELSQLESRVDTLLTWKRARQQERLQLPLDFTTVTALQRRDHLNNNIMVATGNLPAAVVGLDTDWLSFGVHCALRGKRRLVYFSLPLFQCTANAGTDFITNTSGQHNLKNDDLVAFTSTDTLPAGLNSTSVYYVVNRTGSTFQVSLSRGGSAIDITSAGIGTHYYAGGI